MINYLYSAFPGFSTMHIAWGMHKDKGHGLLIDQILLTAKPQLVICPDAGSHEYTYHKILKEHNISLDRFRNNHELIYYLEDILNNYYDEELDNISSELSDMYYYNDVNK